MEAAVAASSSRVLFSTPRRSLVSFPFSSLPCKNSSSKHQLLCLTLEANKKYRNIVKCSSSDSPSVVSSERWLLEPAGDGESRHIGYRVPRPGAFEIASNAVTVGRLPEKADIVLPVATVSGVHARLEKKDGNLLVIDLESTNGTYVNERRLTPGVIATVDPGDTHLAMFRVSKIIVDVPSETNGAKDETQTEVSTVNEASPT